MEGKGSKAAQQEASDEKKPGQVKLIAIGEEVDDNSWPFAVSGDRWSGNFQKSSLLFDSGSDERVCGHGFAPKAPT